MLSKMDEDALKQRKEYDQVTLVGYRSQAPAPTKPTNTYHVQTYLCCSWCYHNISRLKIYCAVATLG